MLKDERNYYQLDFSNIGGLVMPVILEFTFKDGSKSVERIPAEIWRQNNFEVSKVFSFQQEVTSIQLDPFLETADVEIYNNNWPRVAIPTKFELYKQENERKNLMQKMKDAGELKKYE